MKVMLVNGSPHPKGCTFTALETVGEALRAEGISSEMFHVDAKPIRGCTGCMSCVKKGACIYDDTVNEFVSLAKEADGYVFGSPVHYAAASGAMTSFMDRVFFSTYGSGNPIFRLKPGAVVVSARRAGASAAFDQLNKYLTWAEMPVVSSWYWNLIHGNTPEEVKQDHEGIHTLLTLGKNMAWLLKCIEAGRAAGISAPKQEEHVRTNFIR